MAAAAPHLDITIPDGTVLRPGQPFTKIWRVRNSGTDAWPDDTVMVFVGGDKMDEAIISAVTHR